MARLFIPIYAVVVSLFCTEMHQVDSSTKHIEDYSKEYDRTIRKEGQTLSVTTQESSTDDDEEINKKANESDVDYLSNYAEHAGTNYVRLCSEEILLTADIQKKLKCRYVDHGIPFLKIAPFKEEEAYLDPRIVLYHDVIYEEEMESLKTFSKPLLQKSKVANTATGREKISKDRTALTVGIAGEHRRVQLINRRVEHMTGLSIDTAEPLQVAYYGIGGLYVPHYDYFTDVRFFDITNGNRIATVLFYMNDVAKGGTTVFPKLNVTLWPKKGSAAFWYNLKQNGEVDALSAHGGCPVLSGTKWILTKWLHEIGQEFRRPCTLLGNE